MKKAIWILILSIYANTAMAENMTDKLIVTIVNKKLPIVLYKLKNKPWDIGVYSLSVNKAGGARFSSTDKHLILTLPLQLIVNGKINQNLLGTNITIACKSRVTTDGRLYIEPKFKTKGSNANVSISVPVPESQLNCDGLLIPIKPFLEKVISDNKSKWENDIESEIYKLFQQVGL